MFTPKKRGNNAIIVLTFIALFLLIPLVSSATSVVVNPPVEKKAGWFDTYFGFLKSPIFWWIVVGFILITIILVGLFFLIRWLVKFIKSRKDIFYLLKTERMALAKIHSTYNSKHWYKVEKNTPIRLVKKESGKLIISEPIAFHRGNFTTHEGNVVISLNLRNKKKWLFFPITDLLIIPNKESISIERKNQYGKSEPIVISGLPQAKDIVQFNQNEILLFAESLSSVAIFYIPVLKAKDGKIIDLSVPVYQSLKEVVVGDYLYQQSADFVDVAKKSMSLNPNLAYEVKSRDANTNVDIPSDRTSR